MRAVAGIAGALLLVASSPLLPAGRAFSSTASRGAHLGRGVGCLRPWRAQRHCWAARRATGAAVATVGQAAGLPASDFSEHWREEARRCWAADASGCVPGYVADMVTPSRAGGCPIVQREPGRRWCAAAEAEGRSGNPPSGGDALYRDVRLHFQRCSSPTGAAADLGCGRAVVARRLAWDGAFGRVYGVDIAHDMLEHARSAAEKEGLGPGEGLRLLRGDINRLPFREQSLSAVFWGMGLHLLPDPRAALSSIFASLRPGGRLVLTSNVGYSQSRAREMLEAVGFAELSFAMAPHLHARAVRPERGHGESTGR